MQRVLGLVMLTGGLAYGLYAHSPSSDEREEQVAAVTRIIAQGTINEPAVVAAEQPGLRQPVEQSRALPAFAAPGMANQLATPPVFKKIAGPAVAAIADPAPVRPSPWQTEVAPITVTAPATAAPPAARPVQVKAPATQTPRQLARQIQSELKRLGCYGGTLDGSWGSGSRAAMTEFISAVNASLPTNEPDVILLTLLKGHKGNVCGITCGPHQVATGGRCIERDVVASVADPAARVASLNKPSPPLPGRMSIGGPREEPAPLAADSQASITEERLPWATGSTGRRIANDSEAGTIASQHLAALQDAERKRRPDAAPELSGGPSAAVREELRTAPPKRALRANAKPKPNRATERKINRRKYATRAVQNLFLHPLGRM